MPRWCVSRLRSVLHPSCFSPPLPCSNARLFSARTLPPMDDSSSYKWYLIGGGILAGAVVIMVLLGVLAPAPEKGEPPPQSPLVTTTPVETRAGSLLVRGTGTVRPVREIQLTAQSGGRFRAGETLARIDPSDYRNAVRQAQAQVTQAQFQLIQAREESAVARR